MFTSSRYDFGLEQMRVDDVGLEAIYGFLEAIDFVGVAFPNRQSHLGRYHLDKGCDVIDGVFHLVYKKNEFDIIT